MIALILCLIFLIVPQHFVEAIELSKDYSLDWKIAGDEITFDIQAQTLGWVGLGLNVKAQMSGADIVVAGVRSGGKNYIYDLHGLTHDTPPPDSQQDYKILSASQNGTHTNLSIRRKLDTGDKEDHKIVPGAAVTILYAIGEDTPKNIYSFFVHTSRGAVEGNFF